MASSVSRIEWWKAIRGSSLPPRARLLAYALSTYMDPDGSRCFPGQEALAAACGWSDGRAVRKALAVLEGEGFVEVARFAGPRPEEGRTQATHRYLPTLPADQAAHAGREDDDQPEREGREDDTTNRPSGATNRPPEAEQPAREGRQPHHDPANDPATRPGVVVEEQTADLVRAVALVTEAFPLDRPPAPATAREILAPLLGAGWTPDDLGRRFSLELRGTEVKSSATGLLSSIASRLKGELTPAAAIERRRAAQLTKAEALGRDRSHHHADEAEARAEAVCKYRGDPAAQDRFVDGWRSTRHTPLKESA